MVWQEPEKNWECLCNIMSMLNQLPYQEKMKDGDLKPTTIRITLYISWCANPNTLSYNYRVLFYCRLYIKGRNFLNIHLWHLSSITSGISLVNGFIIQTLPCTLY